MKRFNDNVSQEKIIIDSSTIIFFFPKGGLVVSGYTTNQKVNFFRLKVNSEGRQKITAAKTMS